MVTGHDRWCVMCCHVMGHDMSWHLRPGALNLPQHPLHLIITDFRNCMWLMETAKGEPTTRFWIIQTWNTKYFFLDIFYFYIFWWKYLLQFVVVQCHWCRIESHIYCFLHDDQNCPDKFSFKVFLRSERWYLVKE